MAMGVWKDELLQKLDLKYNNFKFKDICKLKSNSIWDIHRSKWVLCIKYE